MSRSDEAHTGGDPTSLGPAQREAALATLRRTSPERPLDLLVVGGGVVGCGAALDAAVRGMSVGLVEAGDLAAGTSSRSSRLAHGGLRYLEQREFALVHEALTERGLLLGRLAPHLVRPVPFLLPASGGVERSYMGAGVALYDMLSRIGAYGGTMPRPRTLSRAAVHGLAPGLRVEAMEGAVRFHDAQIDDARHTVALARTASRPRRRGGHRGPGARPAAPARRYRCVAAGGDPADASPGCGRAGADERGADARSGDSRRGIARAGRRSQPADVQRGPRVTGAVVRDGATGEEFVVHARVVLSATGVWTDDLVAMATGSTPGQSVRRSKGVHLVVPRRSFRSTTAVIARTPAQRAVPPAVERALAGRHHGHRRRRTARVPGRHRPGRGLPARPGQPLAVAGRWSTRTWSACTPACAPCWRPGRDRPRSSRASTPSCGPCPASWPSRAASTPPTA